VINVLIVEDELAISRFLRTALEGDGLRVHEAGTLQRGLIEAATRKPDLVILDLGLPDGDGIDFIREVRQWSQMPILVLSARTEETDKIAALDAGADDYLIKPFGIGELQARLRVALRRHSATSPSGVRLWRYPRRSCCPPHRARGRRDPPYAYRISSAGRAAQ
jgi:two-component system KDP operon response regulator KdpE